MTTGGLPGRPSTSVKPRPMTGLMPSSAKYAHDTTRPLTRSATCRPEGHGAIRVARDLIELRLLRLQGQIVGHREAELVGRGVGVDAHELPGVRIRKRPEQRGIDGAEDQRRRADAEAHRDDDGEREHGDAHQAAEAGADVLNKILKD